MKKKPIKNINGILHYQCNICHRYLPKDNFYKDIRSHLGITSSCKYCHTQTTIRTRNKENHSLCNKLYMQRKSLEIKTKYVVPSEPNEVWKQIIDCEDYFVSNLGRVKSKKWGKEILLKQFVTLKGYYTVNINSKTKRVHRLVAMAFLPNPLKLAEVNHKDENKSNNALSNLEWCNRQYNMSYGTWKERRKRP